MLFCIIWLTMKNKMAITQIIYDEPDRSTLAFQMIHWLFWRKKPVDTKNPSPWTRICRFFFCLTPTCAAILQDQKHKTARVLWFEENKFVWPQGLFSSRAKKHKESVKKSKLWIQSVWNDLFKRSMPLLEEISPWLIKLRKKRGRRFGAAFNSYLSGRLVVCCSPYLISDQTNWIPLLWDLNRRAGESWEAFWMPFSSQKTSLGMIHWN